MKLVTALVLEFKKIENDNETKYWLFYSNSKAETIIKGRVVDDVFESIFNTVISNIKKSL